MRVADGVYAAGPPAELTAETAALLIVGHPSFLSHATGICVWELLWRAPSPTPVHVTTPEPRSTIEPGITVHRSTTLLPRDTVIRKRLPVTAPARTLLDFVASGADARTLELAFDEAKRRGLVTTWKLQDQIARNAGPPGAPALAALLQRAAGHTVTRSEAEERLLSLIRTADLPVPRLNARVSGYEVDAFWPEHHVVVEVDGLSFHSSPSSFERDRAKGAALSAAGLTVLRVTWRQLTGEPLPFLARLAAALAWGRARA